MRWSTLFCIFCILVVVSAENTNDTNANPTEPNTNSTDDGRPKRHLSTLLNIKKAIIEKVFGSSAPAESYKLYRIPGHDNILVKAVPIKVPESGEIPIVAPVNPTVALLESYLGTKTPNETLIALDGVKNLLNSGIINNEALLNQLLVPIQPPKISYRVPQVSPLYPSVFRAPLANEPQPFVVKTPGKLCAIPIPLAPRPVFTREPIRLLPEAPVLPPPAFLPEVLVPPKPVLVREGPVLFNEFLNVPRRNIPTTPVVPVFGNHYPHYPGAYSYQQYNNDGTVTQYTDSKLIRPVVRPAVLPPLITERVQVISEEVAQKEPVFVQVPGTGYLYHQIKNNGFETTFGRPSKIPHVVNVVPEEPRFPGVPISIIEPIIVGKNPAEYGPVHVGKIPKSSNGFSYHQYHSDGSVSLFGDGSQPLARPVVLPSLVTDRINIISEKVVKKPILQGADVFVTEINTPEFGPVKVRKIPKNPSGFSYQQALSDGSATTYIGSDVIKPFLREPTLILNRPDITEIKHPEFGPVHVKKILKKPNGFSYHQVYSDGSETTYTGDGVITPVVREPSQYSALLLNRPGFERNPSFNFGHVVQVGEIPKHPSGFSYQPLHTGGLASTFTGDNGPVEIPVRNPGYSYHLIDNEETITTITGSDGKKTVLQGPPRLSTLLNRPDFSVNHPNFGSVVHVEKIPKAPSGFSYQQVHSDGSATTFIDSNVQPSERPILPPLVADRITTISERMNEGKVPVGNSGYSYQQVNSQGSVPITSGNDGKTPIPEPPKLSTLLPNEVTIPSIKTPQSTTSGQGGISYHQSNGDRSVTTFTGNDAVHKESTTTLQVPVLVSKPASVYQERPQQVIVGSTAGQDGHQYVNVFDVSTSGFSYQQNPNGGPVNTYGINEVTPIVSTPDLPTPPSQSYVPVTGAQFAADGEIVALELPKKPCTQANKCGGDTKVTFETPVVSTYEYKQLVHSNPNKKFTVVNVGDGIIRNRPESSVSSVTVSPVTPSPVSRRPSYRRRTRPTSTEGPLAVNPIVVPEEAGYSYKQTSSDGSTTKIEGSDQHVTVSVSGEVRKTVNRGDIPE